MSQSASNDAAQEAASAAAVGANTEAGREHEERAPEPAALGVGAEPSEAPDPSQGSTGVAAARARLSRWLADPVGVARESAPTAVTQTVDAVSRVWQYVGNPLLHTVVNAAHSSGGSLNRSQSDSGGANRSELSVEPSPSVLQNNMLQTRLPVHVLLLGDGGSGRTTLAQGIAAVADARIAFFGSSSEAKGNGSSLVYSFVSPTPMSEMAAFFESDIMVQDLGPGAPCCHDVQAALPYVDVVMIVMSLVRVKQRRTRAAVEPSFLARLLGRTEVNEVLVHQNDIEALNSLLSVLRSGRSDSDGAPLQLLFVGTFQDTLTDSSVLATVDVLRELQQIAESLTSGWPTPPTWRGFYAVDQRRGTGVSVQSNVVTGHTTRVQDIWEWVCRLCVERRVGTVADWMANMAALYDIHLRVPQQPQSERQWSFRTLGESKQQQGEEGTQDSPPSASLAVNPRAIESLLRRPDVLARTMHVIRVAKAEGTLFFVRVDHLWRLLYGAGLEDKEELYIILRLLERTGEVRLLCRPPPSPLLRHLHQGHRLVREKCATDCLCLDPALLQRASAAVYLYHCYLTGQGTTPEAGRLLRKSVDLDACELADPHCFAARGVFSRPLLHHLSSHLRQRTGSVDSEQLLRTLLILADLAFELLPEPPAASTSCGTGGSGGGTPAAWKDAAMGGALTESTLRREEQLVAAGDFDPFAESTPDPSSTLTSLARDNAKVLRPAPATAAVAAAVDGSPRTTPSAPGIEKERQRQVGCATSGDLIIPSLLLHLPCPAELVGAARQLARQQQQQCQDCVFSRVWRLPHYPPQFFTVLMSRLGAFVQLPLFTDAMWLGFLFAPAHTQQSQPANAKVVEAEGSAPRLSVAANSETTSAGVDARAFVYLSTSPPSIAHDGSGRRWSVSSVSLEVHVFAPRGVRSRNEPRLSAALLTDEIVRELRFLLQRSFPGLQPTESTPGAAKSTETGHGCASPKETMTLAVLEDLFKRHVR